MVTPDNRLASLGFAPGVSAHLNLPPAALVEHALRRGE
ncbi:hypothetical protein SAMN06269173_1081, partial [Hymenobacter mucosus]